MRRPRGRKATPPGTCQKKGHEETPWEEGHPTGTCQKGPKTGTQFRLQLPKSFVNIDESKVVCYVDGEVLDYQVNEGEI